jgi:hypothetical protein
MIVGNNYAYYKRIYPKMRGLSSIDRLEASKKLEPEALADFSD